MRWVYFFLVFTFLVTIASLSLFILFIYFMKCCVLIVHAASYTFLPPLTCKGAVTLALFQSMLTVSLFFFLVPSVSVRRT